MPKQSGHALFIVLLALAGSRSDAAVAPLDPPPSTPQISGSVGSTSLTTAFTVSPGSHRLLMVTVTPGFTSSHGLTTVTASYGNQLLTQLALSDPTQRRFTWLGYLRESDISAATGNSLAVALGGDTSGLSGTNAYIFSYEGVDQNNPINESGDRYMNNLDEGVSLSLSLTVPAAGYGLFVIHVDNSSNPLDGGTDAYSFTPGDQSGSSGNYSRLAHRAFVAPSETNISLYYGQIRAGVVGATLNPTDDLLFADGFESGTTSAWSDQYPP